MLEMHFDIFMVFAAIVNTVLFSLLSTLSNSIVTQTSSIITTGEYYLLNQLNYLDKSQKISVYIHYFSFKTISILICMHIFNACASS